MRHAATVGLLLVVSFGYGESRACQCPSPGPSVSQSLELVDAVFLGQLESRWPSLSRQGGYCLSVQTYRFRVLQSWKGEIGDSVVLADTGGQVGKEVW